MKDEADGEPPPPEDGAQAQTPFSLVGGVVRRLVVLAGWLAIVGASAALLFEGTGTLNRWIEREVARRLGEGAGELEIGATEIEWLERRVVLRDISFGEDGRDLFLSELELIFDWSGSRGMFLERAVAVDGHVRVSRALTRGLEGLLDRGDAGPKREDIEVGSTIPMLALRDVEVSVESPNTGDLPIGTVDACLRRDEGARPRLTGRLIPAVDEGAEDPGVVFLAGRLESDGLLRVRGAARDLALTTASLPAGSPLEELRALEPEAVFDLEARGEYRLGESVLPEVRAELRVSGGNFRIPYIDRADDRRVEDVAFELSASFLPGEGGEVWERELWDVTGHLHAAWEGIAVEAWGRCGRSTDEGVLADLWIDVPGLPADPHFLDVAGAEERAKFERQVLDIFEPGGSVHVMAGVRIPTGWSAEPDPRKTIERAIGFYPEGRASAAFHGGINKLTGARDLGFPLRLERVDGHAILAFNPRLKHLPETLGFYDLVGHHPGGEVEFAGAIHVLPLWFLPPEVPRSMKTRFLHFRATSENLPVDGELERAFAGLSGLVPEEELWGRYHPDGGTLGFQLEFWTNPWAPGLASDVLLSLHDVGLTWQPFPLPFTGAHGYVRFVSDGKGTQEQKDGRSALTLALAGETEAARGPVIVVGRTEGDSGAEPLGVYEVNIDEINLRNRRLRALMVEPAPVASEALTDSGAAGWANVAITWSKFHEHGSAWTHSEIETGSGGLQLQPERFPMDTRDVLARAITVSELPPRNGIQPEARNDATVAVYGRWASGDASMPVACRASFPYMQNPVMRFFGAGADIANPAVIGAATTALETSTDSDTDVDLTKLELVGHLDFETTFVLPETPGEELVDYEMVLYARLPLLGLGDVQLLKNLHGKFRYTLSGEEWIGEDITAELGSTPVVLNDFRYFLTEEGARLETKITADDMLFDREHLQYFLDEQTLEMVLDELELRGRFDVDGALLTLDTTNSGETRLRFDGALTVRDMFVNLGVPVAVRAANDVTLDLTYEGNRVRAFAQVRDLYGTVADRSLVGAEMLVSYIEPKLTIEELDGEFESGRLRSLGLGTAGSAGFFSIDFREPFPFVLSAEMEAVDLGGLLAGVFNSDFANEGELEAELRLSGDLERLTGIRGQGYVVFKDSGLWSIPLFQSLFSQLGFDTTATFRRMQSHFTVEDGVVYQSGMRVKSDLLSLVGEGWMTFEGGLHHDLEVRYSLIDKLGPITRLLYEIQNSLLRISVRGDMSRPEVSVKGLFSQFFPTSKGGVQALPLPALSVLRKRF